MGHFGHHMGHGGHHPGCGCQACSGSMECKKMLVLAMIFFGMIAIANAIVAGMIHLKLHAGEVFKH